MKSSIIAVLRIVPFLLVASVASAQECAITNITLGDFVYHEPDSLFYSQPVEVTYTNPPETGVLGVYAQGINWFVSRTSEITGSPQEVVLNGLPADGFDVTVTAVFSADPFCTDTAGEVVYTAPSPGAAPTDARPVNPSDGYELSFAPMVLEQGARIRYAVPQAGSVSLRVYDASGRLVRTLVEGFKPIGAHEVLWRGRDDQGMQVSSGVYFAVLRGANTQKSLRVVLLQ